MVYAEVSSVFSALVSSALFVAVDFSVDDAVVPSVFSALASSALLRRFSLLWMMRRFLLCFLSWFLLLCCGGFLCG